MKDDEYKGYYCLLIAILCDLNAAEAQCTNTDQIIRFAGKC